MNYWLSIFSCGDQEGQIWVEVYWSYWQFVNLQSLEALPCLIIPNFYRVIVTSCYQMGLISFIEVYCIYRTLMSSESKVCLALSSQIPYFNCLIHGSRSEFSEVLWVKCQSHHKMFMLIQGPYQGKVFLKIPYFYFGVIWGCNHIWLSRVNNDCPYKISMGLNCIYFLHCIVVEYSQLKVIRTTYDPVLLRNESYRSYWKSWSLQGS